MNRLKLVSKVVILVNLMIYCAPMRTDGEVKQVAPESDDNIYSEYRNLLSIVWIEWRKWGSENIYKFDCEYEFTARLCAGWISPANCQNLSFPPGDSNRRIKYRPYVSEAYTPPRTSWLSSAVIREKTPFLSGISEVADSIVSKTLVVDTKPVRRLDFCPKFGTKCSYKIKLTNISENPQMMEKIDSDSQCADEFNVSARRQF